MEGTAGKLSQSVDAAPPCPLAVPGNAAELTLPPGVWLLGHGSGKNGIVALLEEPKRYRKEGCGINLQSHPLRGGTQ